MVLRLLSAAFDACCWNQPRKGECVLFHDPCNPENADSVGYELRKITISPPPPPDRPVGRRLRARLVLVFKIRVQNVKFHSKASHPPLALLWRDIEITVQIVLCLLSG